MPNRARAAFIAGWRIEALLASGAVFEPARIAPHLAKSARTGNDNAPLSVS